MTSHDPEDIVTEFYIDGAWTSTYGGENLAARVRGNDAIRLTSGGADQFSSITSRTSSYTLNNGDNLFTDDDPMSPLFRKFGQSTRVRHSILHPTRGQDLYAKVMDQPEEPNGTRIYTADKASLDITGDIDVRWEMDVMSTRNLDQFIIGKFQLSTQMSWLIYITDTGRIVFVHTTGGTSGTLLAEFSDPGTIPEVETRKAYRVTLDVNNGAAGRTYTWYTSDSIDGTWTQVDTAIVAGTTSIYSGTASLAISAGGNGDIVLGSVSPFRGKIYGAQVYSGIAGTLVADFRPNMHASIGQTTWADTCASPNTWIIENAGQDDGLPAIRIGSDRIRFTGENQTRPDDWDLSGVDRWCAMTAQGTLARYQSTRAALKSATTRYFSQLPNVGHWPCEDGRDATSIGNTLDGGNPGVINDCSFTSADGFSGSSGAVQLNTVPGSTVITKAITHAATGAWSVLFYFHVDELPASTSVLCNIYPRSSSIHRWVVNVNLTGFDFQGLNSAGTSVTSAGVAFGSGVDPVSGWVAVYMAFEQVGTSLRWQTAWHQVGSTTTYTHAFGGTTVASSTAGTIERIHFIPTAASLADVQFSQINLWNYEYQITSAFAEISRGYAGERWGRRWIRLLREEGITPEWVGNPDLTEECGPQPATTLYDIMAEGAKLDGGMVTESRDVPLAWLYVSGASLGNRKRLDLSYSGSEIKDVPRPTGDGRYTVNDFTAARDNGSEARYEATDVRRKNVREPDDPVSPGVGRVERSESFNAYLDERMWYIASFRVHLGTWDERIIPTMRIYNHRNQISGQPALLADIFAQDIGDPIGIVDVAGSPMPPNDVRSVVTGYTETIDNLTHEIAFNTVPQGPYDTPILTSSLADYDPRLDADDDETQIHGALTTTATSVTWSTDTSGRVPFWVWDAGYGTDIGGGNTFDIDIGGERITVSSITAPTSSAAVILGTFEATGSASEWTASGGSWARSTTFAFAGTWSALLTVSGSPANAFIRPDVAYRAPVREGYTYTAAAQCRTGSTLNVGMLITWFDAAGGAISTVTNNTSLASGAWAARSITAVAPAGAVAAQYGPLLTGSPANGSLLYADEVTFTSTGLNFQTATLTRSVNSIVKAHTTGSIVRLFDPSYLGRI